MEEFKLYSVSDEYVEWLRGDFPNVYSNKVNTRNVRREYYGVAFVFKFKYLALQQFGVQWVETRKRLIEYQQLRPVQHLSLIHI